MFIAVVVSVVVAVVVAKISLLIAYCHLLDGASGCQRFCFLRFN
jgi:hypothetical protein